jgi:hypothetical protein
MARHRSYFLWWTNQFRHWWKSSRLLVRLGGLSTYAHDAAAWAALVAISPLTHKSVRKAFKYYKHLGQGGPMRWFLKIVHPFTRGCRILVGAWRWVESAQCRRFEVGVEEFMVSTSSLCTLRTSWFVGLPLIKPPAFMPVLFLLLTVFFAPTCMVDRPL